MVGETTQYIDTYKEVYPIGSTTLKSGESIYEAQKEIPCAFCDTPISVNSLFARKRWYPPTRRKDDKALFLPVCRMCKPFQVCKYINKQNPLMRVRELEWVDDSEGSANERRDRITAQMNGL